MTTTAMRSTAGTSILTRTATRCWSRGRPSRGKRAFWRMQHRLDAGSGRLERGTCAGHGRQHGAAERDAGDDRGRQVLPHRHLAFALSQQSVYFGLSGKRVRLVRPGPVVSGGKDCAPDGPGGRAQDRQPECSETGWARPAARRRCGSTHIAMRRRQTCA